MKKGILLIFLVAIFAFQVVKVEANHTNFYKLSSELQSYFLEDDNSELSVIVKFDSLKVNSDKIDRIKLQHKNSKNNINDMIIKNISKTNKSYLKKFDFDFDVISSYDSLPLVAIKVNIDKLLSIVEYDFVEYVYLDKEVEINSNSFTDAEVTVGADISNTVHLDTTNISDVLNNYNVDGKYHTIGIIDYGIVDVSESVIANNILITNSDSSVDDHATAIAHIMVGANGVAPEADIVSYGLVNTPEDEDFTITESRLFQSFDFMATQDVDVVNVSVGITIPDEISYNNYSQMIDNFISVYNIPVVIASGNNNCGYSFICNKLAYSKNAIIVGSSDIYGRYISDFSSYIEAVSSDKEPFLIIEHSLNIYYVDKDKADVFQDSTPDLVAPGGSTVNRNGAVNAYEHWNGIDKLYDYQKLVVGTQGFQMVDNNAIGTSFAAPIVTASIILMMERDSKLRNNPSLVKSILTRSANSTAIITYKDFEGAEEEDDPKIPDFHPEDGYSDKQGAGLLDLHEAFKIIDNESFNYFNNFGASSSIPLEFDLDLNSGDEINFSIVLDYYQDVAGSSLMTYYDLRAKITSPSENTTILGTREGYNQNLTSYTASEDGVHHFSFVRNGEVITRVIENGAISWDLPIPVYEEPTGGGSGGGSGGGGDVIMPW